MDLQKMLSQISPEQLQKGMKQLGLNAEQMNQVNNMVSGGGANKGLNNLSSDDINAFLKDNPNLAKQAKMMGKFTDIFGK